MKYFYLIILSFLILHSSFGQDPQFTQFYNNPLQLNPALAGASSTGRIITGYRTQWPKLSTYVSQFVSGDVFIPSSQKNAAFGLGILASKDVAGSKVALSTTNINVLGSIEVHLGSGKMKSPSSTKWLIRGGIQYEFFTRMIGGQSDGFIFEDQLISGGTTTENFQRILGESIQFSDLAIGTVLSGETVWLGVAVHHLTRPNISITDSSYHSDIERLYTKWTLHGGGRLPIGSIGAVRIDGQYRRQGNNEQFSLGANYLHRLDGVAGTLILGTGFRAIPLFARTDQSMMSWDAITLQLGIDFDEFARSGNSDRAFFYGTSLVYSYDHGISSLTTTYANSHEVTLSFRIQKVKVDCPSHLKWANRERFSIINPGYVNTRNRRAIF